MGCGSKLMRARCRKRCMRCSRRLPALRLQLLPLLPMLLLPLLLLLPMPLLPPLLLLPMLLMPPLPVPRWIKFNLNCTAHSLAQRSWRLLLMLLLRQQALRQKSSCCGCSSSCRRCNRQHRSIPLQQVRRACVTCDV